MRMLKDHNEIQPAGLKVVSAFDGLFASWKVILFDESVDDN